MKKNKKSEISLNSVNKEDDVFKRKTIKDLIGKPFRYFPLLR